MENKKSSKNQSLKASAAHSSHPAHGDSRAALLVAAAKVIAAKGFEGTTVKDLADEAGVNVSLVSYYFGGKEGLYKTCMENFGLERVAGAERILKAPGSPEEFRLRLQLFAESVMEIYIKEPDMLKLVHRALDGQDQVALELFNSVFIRMFTALVAFLSSAQASGFVRPEVDIEITASLVFGSLIQIIRSDEMCKLLGRRTLMESAYRESVIKHWINQNMFGLAVKDQKS